MLLVLFSMCQLPPKPCVISLLNGGFEAPTTNVFSLFTSVNVPGWNTTSSDDLIEIWRSGFFGVPSYSGDQFAELNATEVSNLYLDICTSCASSDISWEFAHRGRAGVDVCELQVGPPGGPYTTLAIASDSSDAWGVYSGLYAVPAGETVIRLLFVSVSATGGDAAIGNFLDGVTFTSLLALTSNFSTAQRCIGAATTFKDLSISNGANITNWKWYFGDGDSIVGVQNPSHLYSDTGSYNVTLVVTNDSNCTDSITIPLIISSDLSINQTQAICQGDSLLLGGGYQKMGGIYIDTLQTINGCDSIVSTTLEVKPNFNSTRNQTICQGDSVLFGGVYYDSTGTYIDSFQTVLGCDSLLTLNLIVNLKYQINQTQIICQGDSVLLGGRYQKSSGIYIDSSKTVLLCDSIINTTLVVNDSYSDSSTKSICDGDSLLIGGVYQKKKGVYSDSLLSIYGCDSILIVNLLVDSIPAIITSNNTIITSCGSAQLNVSGALSYTWSPSTGLTCSTCANPIARPRVTTVYTVTAFVNSCFLTDTIRVTVEGKSTLIIPNVFSPNNDGYNDSFNLIGECIESVDKKVFNRWGELLFQSKDINEAWDGRIRAGREVPEGTYFYIFDVSYLQEEGEVSKTYKGSISLFR